MLCCILTLLLLAGKGLCSEHQSPLPCNSNSDWNISLENAVHFSDLVLVGGRIVHSFNDQFGTISVSVSIGSKIRWPKRDGLLSRTGFGRQIITNFPSKPTESAGTNRTYVFFLGRQTNLDLGIFCMSTLEDLLRVNPEFENTAKLFEHMTDTGKGDMERNNNQVLPYPNPCDDPATNDCPSQGSDCSVLNTLSGEDTRCICKTGFTMNDNGRNCKALDDSAIDAYCSECGFNAQCSKNKPGNCTCDHFKCPEKIRQKLHMRVCGSDKITYPSLCHLLKASCEQQKPVHRLNWGNCPETFNEICKGRDYPLYTSAGLVRCHESLSCPQLHFCDSISTHGVCCPHDSSSSGSGSGDLYPGGSGAGDANPEDEENGYTDNESGDYEYM